MPFTPLHLGPALFFGLLLFRYIHFPTFIIANIIIDVEPFLILFFDLDHPLHGFFHSFAGGSVVAIALAFFISKMDKYIQEPARSIKLSQDFSLRGIWLASFSGVYLHILLDSTLYSDIRPFYPSDLNPFLNNSILSGFDTYLLCVILFISGFLLYGYKVDAYRSININRR
jgi:membrane-bound metal-dependent hydrolase YbcI (DUF457 family)